MTNEDLIKAQKKLWKAEVKFNETVQAYREEHGHYGKICTGGPLRCEDCRCGK